MEDFLITYFGSNVYGLIYELVYLTGDSYDYGASFIELNYDIATLYPDIIEQMNVLLFISPKMFKFVHKYVDINNKYLTKYLIENPKVFICYKDFLRENQYNMNLVKITLIQIMKERYNFN